MLSVSVTITVLLLAFCSVAVAVVNKEVNRRIDASSAVLRVHTDIKTAEVNALTVQLSITCA